jgi:hypothetical protein
LVPAPAVALSGFTRGAASNLRRLVDDKRDKKDLPGRGEIRGPALSFPGRHDILFPG